jgi:hypothetical protein
MNEKQQAIELLSKCKCLSISDELKMIHIAFRYWENGSSVDDAVSEAATFILQHPVNEIKY